MGSNSNSNSNSSGNSSGNSNGNSNSNGMAVGHRRFEPLFAASVALDMPVFVHALKPSGMGRLVRPAPLQQVRTCPTQVGLAVVSVIFGGLLLPRLQQGWDGVATLKAALPAHPLSRPAGGSAAPGCSTRPRWATGCRPLAGV